MRTFILSLCALSALGLAACGDSTGTDAGTDAGSDGGGIDMGTVDLGPVDMGGGGTDCATYCAEMTTNCTGANAQYADMADCMTYCAAAGWPAGTAGAMSGDTIACRIYHGGVAAGDPATHCPHAGPTGGQVCGSVPFRTDADTAYTRVDRMGMPAVSTALVPSANKNAYNDASPADDVAMTFAGNILGQLAALHTALDDDFTTLGLTPCTATAASGLPECATQEVAAGVSVVSLVVPDTLQVNPAAPAAFPNGRKLDDPVIDITLAAIFLRMGGACGAGTCNAGTLAAVPVNPHANDVAFLTTFPYLAPMHPAP